MLSTFRGGYWTKECAFAACLIHILSAFPACLGYFLSTLRRCHWQSQIAFSSWWQFYFLCAFTNCLWNLIRALRRWRSDAIFTFYSWLRQSFCGFCHAFGNCVGTLRRRAGKSNIAFSNSLFCKFRVASCCCLWNLISALRWRRSDAIFTFYSWLGQSFCGFCRAFGNCVRTLRRRAGKSNIAFSDSLFCKFRVTSCYCLWKLISALRRWRNYVISTFYSWLGQSFCGFCHAFGNCVWTWSPRMRQIWNAFSSWFFYKFFNAFRSCFWNFLSCLRGCLRNLIAAFNRCCWQSCCASRNGFRDCVLTVWRRARNLYSAFSNWIRQLEVSFWSTWYWHFLSCLSIRMRNMIGRMRSCKRKALSSFCSRLRHWKICRKINC